MPTRATRVLCLLVLCIGGLRGALYAQDTLAPDQCLGPDDSIATTGYVLVYQGDGNLVLYDAHWSPSWATMAFHAPGWLCMQGDGNLVAYDNGGVARWASGTAGNPGAYLTIYDVGAIAIRRADGTPFWGQPFLPTGPPPPPPTQSHLVLVNGSRVDPLNSWIAPGHGDRNAIEASYGMTAEPYYWHENSIVQVLPPYYFGIQQGAWGFANFIESLPGNISVVAHSHGGNVVLFSRYFTARPLRSLTNLATPINYDFWDWRFTSHIARRCQVSSWTDLEQFIGASPYQIYNFIASSIQAEQSFIQAIVEYQNGNHEYALWALVEASAWTYAAYGWYESTKRELAPTPTHFFGSVSHSYMHSPPVWGAIEPYCRY